MEENNNKNKKITKKQIVTISIGVSILIVLAITATYAFFRFGNSNAFGTSKITGKTPSSDASSVVLENINDELTINLNTEDMLQANGNTTYWASPEGKKTVETINQIGRAKAMVEGTYTCNYTMTIEDKAEESIYTAFQGMNTKSNNQIVLTVNEETYDFNTSNLFPITYNGILEGITQSDYQYITASMYIKNEQEIDQTQLSDKDIDIEFKVTELKCKENRELPTITRFAIGENSDEGILYGNEPTVYIEWNNENITQYCITNTNDVSTCTWTNTTSNNGIEIEYPITGNIGDTITLYSYIKDNEGFISQVASKTVTISQTYPLTITKGLGVEQICTKINGASEYTCETPSGDIITKEVNYNSEYSYYGITTNNSIFDNCYDNNTHSCNGTMDNTEGKTHTIAPNMAKYVISISNTTGSNGVITQTHDSTVQTGSNATTDYRYIGASNNVNNYVCLGNIKANGQCIDDNHLYRIIGVIPTQTTKSGSYENRIKLIKHTEYLDDDKLSAASNTPSGYGYIWTGQKEKGTDKYTSYSGADSDPSNWEESTLNRKVLNQTYYNSLEEKYQNMIGNSVWYLGGRDRASQASEMYKSERSENVCSTSYICSETKGTSPIYAERKIGLMYPSDYGYATKGGSTTNRNTCLTTNLGSWHGSGVTDCKNNDWLHMSNSSQWTISPRLNDNYYAFFLSYYASIIFDNATFYLLVIRPTFYLTKDIKIISGNGSISTPYTLGQ